MKKFYDLKLGDEVYLVSKTGEITTETVSSISEDFINYSNGKTRIVIQDRYLCDAGTVSKMSSILATAEKSKAYSEAIKIVSGIIEMYSHKLMSISKEIKNV
ncbi:hypothetical protein [Tenacibaculum sp.]|uniref:hypothetical protein n=1 Tax=Tenacibaculum sp. TaxID=1906242 RepID=UPI003D10BB5F